MHVLHLIDALDAPPQPVALALCADLIAAQPQVRHGVCALGPAHLLDAARRADLRVDHHLPAPGRSSWRAAWQLRRFLPAQHPDVLHLWSTRACKLLSIIAPRQPRLLTLTDAAAPAPARLAPLIRLGGGEHGLLPGVDPHRFQPLDRRALRMRWGVSDEKLMVVAVIGDPLEKIDAMTGMLAVGLAREAGRELRVLLSPHARGLHRARHVTTAARRPELVITDEAMARPWEVLGGVDVAIVLGGALTAAWAMAAGATVLAPRTHELDSIVSDTTAGRATRGSIGELARRLCELVDREDERRALAAAARAHAAAQLDIARFAASMARAYDQVAGGAAELTDLAADKPWATRTPARRLA